MSTLANVIQVLSIMVNPTAPITGALVDRVKTALSKPAEQSQSLDVDASGEGTTYEQAVDNAKARAIESVTGQFVINNKLATDGTYSESTASYTAGVIRQHKVVNHFVDAIGLHRVMITATVVVGKNNIVTSKVRNNVYIDDGTSEGIIDDIERRAEFVRQLEKQPMYIIDVTNVEKQINQTNQFVNLNVNYSVRLSEKYIDDIQTLARIIGVPLTKGQPYTYAVCSPQCFDIGQHIPSIHKRMYFVATVLMKDGRKVKHEFNISDHQRNLIHLYRNNGVSLIENGYTNVRTTVRMTKADALQMKSVTFEAVGL